MDVLATIPPVIALIKLLFPAFTSATTKILHGSIRSLSAWRSATEKEEEQEEEREAAEEDITGQWDMRKGRKRIRERGAERERGRGRGQELED